MSAIAAILIAVVGFHAGNTVWQTFRMAEAESRLRNPDFRKQENPEGQVVLELRGGVCFPRPLARGVRGTYVESGGKGGVLWSLMDSGSPPLRHADVSFNLSYAGFCLILIGGGLALRHPSRRFQDAAALLALACGSVPALLLAAYYLL